MSKTTSSFHPVLPNITDDSMKGHTVFPDSRNKTREEDNTADVDMIGISSGDANNDNVEDGSPQKDNVDAPRKTEESGYGRKIIIGILIVVILVLLILLIYQQIMMSLN